VAGHEADPRCHERGAQGGGEELSRLLKKAQRE
jgi:hypothetical protein